MTNFNLEIISPTGIVFSGNCHMVSVPSVEGDMGIMFNHEIVAANLKAGQVIIFDEQNNATQTFDIDSGFVEVKSSGGVLVLID